MSETRIERDSMGEIEVPKNALYGAQTQRAHNNFPISGIGFNRDFIKALGLIKQTAAKVNTELECLDAEISTYIVKAAQEVIDGELDEHFVIDIFQTGSGTSSNMNANEVIAHRATELAAAEGNDHVKVHPNDHVNFGQSSNDVIPTAIRVAALLSVHEKLYPALERLETAFLNKGDEYAHVVKTGRTHLMDAMPVTIQQEFGGYARQIALGRQRVNATLVRLGELPQGGTAVGTGINTHGEFGYKFASTLSELTSRPFTEAVNHFEAQATVDAPAETSGQLKTLACSMLKMANDLRWMNSGPYGGLGEIQLKAIQPGSSIMPGKVNPVIEESVAMVCAQVIGNDTTITVAAQSGNFELNVMLPVVAHNLLQSIEILANAANNLAERSVEVLTVKEAHIAGLVAKNPILVTALNPVIGYDLGAKIAKKAFAESRALKDVALEMTDLSSEELDKYLDPMKMTKGGFTE
ncbi:Fumarate hydratase class II [Sulfidibacter corallicola]|uniref:Fumarate hydratase class II n=1 Tax=Sulfidibacter corallicola TaxID=2818388 RepID=A0A8A4TSL2_SULCO|nr:class II fumarate hydratase [Sulfidibacter corallicola]QTD52530.1 class II fumarate hydratase [Sulfidibacter corallicola]